MSWAPKDLAQFPQSSGPLDDFLPATPGGELARWTRAAVMPADLMDEVSSNGEPSAPISTESGHEPEPRHCCTSIAPSNGKEKPF